MKAYLRSVRIAPKKANIVVKMVRGMPVGEAMELLRRTNKKAARIVEKLIASAVANARHNDKQHPTDLVIKSIIVNQSLGYARGVPMARGRIRSMTKFLSHIDLALGIADATSQKPEAKGSKKAASPKPPVANTKNKTASQQSMNAVKESPAKSAPQESPSASDSSVSSAS